MKLTFIGAVVSLSRINAAWLILPIPLICVIVIRVKLVSSEQRGALLSCMTLYIQMEYYLCEQLLCALPDPDGSLFG